jgi:hypothetical protein
METNETPKWKYFIPFYGIYATYKSETPGKGKWWVVSILVTLIFVSLFTDKKKESTESASSSTSTTEVTSSSETATESPKTEKIGTPDQIPFYKKFIELKEKYRQGENEIKKSAVYREMAAYVISYIPNKKIENWEGKINKIGTNEGGSKVYINIESDIDDFEIEFKTHNNDFSDYSDNTMISLNSTVYKQLENLKEGDKIVFSASFISDSKKGFKQSNITEQSNITSPEFVVRFTNIKLK